MHRCFTNVPMQREPNKAWFSMQLAKDRHIWVCHQAKRGGIGLWGEKVDDGVDGYGEWWNVGLHKFSVNLRVAQATLAKFEN